MYGGLFGDLPSAKKQKTTPSANNNNNNNDEDDSKTTNDTKECDTNNKPANGVDSKTLSAPASKGNWLVPPRQASTKANTTTTNNKNNKSQFLQTVGKSGTTMAFIPAAAMKSKRKKPSNNNDKVVTNNKPDDGVTKKAIPAPSNTEQPSSFAAVTTTTTTTRIAVSETDKTKAAVVVDIHGSGDDKPDSNLGTIPANQIPNASFQQAIHMQDTAQEEKITDLYDPYVPNDLLEYWETLAAKKHREKLERDTRQALKNQKAMRQQLEEDRKALLQNTTSGAAAFPARAASMGRGRGVSNLPAWMVEKQRANSGVGTTTVPSPRGRGRGVSNLPAWLVEKQRKEANGQ